MVPAGRLVLFNGPRRVLRGFHQELAHDVVHRQPGTILWCDGEHGFDPYAYAERNLVDGYAADEGAQRVLIKRCMTPFQWDSVLTQHLDQKLLEVDTSLVLVAPYDRLFSTDELKDWEQEDYVRFSLRHLRALAVRHQVSVVLSVDMARWWRTHPVLAAATYEAVDARWSVSFPAGRWRAEEEGGSHTIDPYLRRGVTLLDFVEPQPPQVAPPRELTTSPRLTAA